jgi:hypothetical protein
MGANGRWNMMAKKTISLAVLSSFLVFEWSCVSLGGAGGKVRDTIQVDVSRTDTKNVKAQIFSVVKRDGKRILFPERSPARFDPAAQAVVGVALQQFVFAKNEIEITRGGKKDVITSVRTADGRSYEVLSSLDEGENVRVNAYAPISIPLAEIQLLSIAKPHRSADALVILVAVAAAGVVGAVLIKSLLRGIFDPFKGIGD